MPGGREEGAMADQEAAGVLVVCEDTLERAGLKALLGGRSDIRIIGEASTLADVPQLAADLHPDVIVDVERFLHAGTAGSAARAIGALNGGAQARVIILASALNEFAIDLMRGGKCVILDKNISSEELIAAIRVTVAGYIPVKEKLMIDLARATVRLQGSSSDAAGRLNSLTRQERRVMTLIIQGMSNPEIAANLSLAESTVKSHVQGILKKLGLRDRTQIIIYAYEGGLICRNR